MAADYLRALIHVLGKVDLSAISRLAARLDLARRAGATIFVAGNGGSAAIASHWVNDLGKATRHSGHEPLRALSLSDNVPWLTALANDEGYERIFAGQLEALAQPGDVLVVISASGNSPNLVLAAELARVRGVTSIGLLGFDGGKLREMVSDYVWLPTAKGAYGLVEDTHAAICHILTTCLTYNESPPWLTLEAD